MKFLFLCTLPSGINVFPVDLHVLQMWEITCLDTRSAVVSLVTNPPKGMKVLPDSEWVQMELA